MPVVSKLLQYLVSVVLVLFTGSLPGLATEDHLRVLTWDGYITEKDISNIHRLFQKHKLAVRVKVLQPYSEGPEQMFNVIRSGKCEISFLTLFFIKMNQQRITRLLQPVDVTSPRFSNYKYVIEESKSLEMGMQEGKPLYVPFGGGVYGFYVDTHRVAAKDIPDSLNDLWLPKWKGKVSLNKTQIWYNIGISLMALKLPPFHLNDLLTTGRRSEAVKLAAPEGKVFRKLSGLYNQAGDFWTTGTRFSEDLLIVSSWGPEIEKRNEKYPGRWKKIKFREGNIIWLDTINFMKGLAGNRLKAAEIFANYFLEKEVQERLVNELSMIAISTQVLHNPLVKAYPDIFRSSHFVPPYSENSDNLMQKISGLAMPGKK